MVDMKKAWESVPFTHLGLRGLRITYLSRQATQSAHAKMYGYKHISSAQNNAKVDALNKNTLWALMLPFLPIGSKVCEVSETRRIRLINAFI